MNDDPLNAARGILLGIAGMLAIYGAILLALWMGGWI